jgi:hypothetical protein
MSIDEPDPERPEPEQPDTMPEEEPGVTAPEPDTLPRNRMSLHQTLKPRGAGPFRLP